jgi:ATP-dependent Clp protease protease subunit
MGSKRYMYNHSLMMIHGVKLNGYESHTLNDVKDLNDNVNLFMETIKNIYMENSNITEEQLEKFFLKDKWISASEALSYGLIDEII